MFSTSMTASSTTSPIAMANPPRVMVLKLKPSLSNTMTAVIRERGMAAQEHRKWQQCVKRLGKTGGRLVKHARYYWLLLAEGHLSHRKNLAHVHSRSPKLVNDSSTKIGPFSAFFSVVRIGKATEPKGC